VLSITAVQGDIAEQDVDVIVLPTDPTLRGTSSASRAIHRAGGPSIQRECIEKFPNGLREGDAGWTTAGDLPARWVVHTVSPNHTSESRSLLLLQSCYRRTLELVDELGARSVAFPLVGTGAAGWPLREAISVAVESIASTETRAEDVRLVTPDTELYEYVRWELASKTPIRILQGVQVLHQRGYHRLRIMPGISPSGLYWRIAITSFDNVAPDVEWPWSRGSDQVLRYSTGGLTEFAGGEVTVMTPPEEVADLILSALPDASPDGGDPGYVIRPGMSGGSLI
jgi:O-acetyl-ADP-ribose deacetylase (regulator of RNase III)